MLGMEALHYYCLLLLACSVTIHGSDISEMHLPSSNIKRQYICPNTEVTVQCNFVDVPPTAKKAIQVADKFSTIILRDMRDCSESAVTMRRGRSYITVSCDYKVKISNVKRDIEISCLGGDSHNIMHRLSAAQMLIKGPKVVSVVTLFTGCGKPKKRKPTVQMHRDMDDTLRRFYAMLNVLVSFKGRPTYIDKATMDIKIKQPLEMAFYKIFQAMLNFPSNRPLKALVDFTCRDVLYNEIEKEKLDLGLSDYPVGMIASQIFGNGTARDVEKLWYQKNAQESRTKICEDTISRFFSLIDLYTPYNMRPKLLDEQVLPEDQWEDKIKQPIREAFQSFIQIMRNSPTTVCMQQLLVDFTNQTLLPRWETGYMKTGLSLPSDTVAAKKALAKYIYEYNKVIGKSELQCPAVSNMEPEPKPHLKVAISPRQSPGSSPSRRKSSTPGLRHKQVRDTDRKFATDLGYACSSSSAFCSEKDDYVVTKVHRPNLTEKQRAQVIANCHSNAKDKDKQVRDTDRKFATDLRYARSSSSALCSEKSEDDYEVTQAINYRPVLTEKQRAQVIANCHSNAKDKIYACYTKENSGYPSKRRRENKSSWSWSGQACSGPGAIAMSNYLPGQVMFNV